MITFHFHRDLKESDLISASRDNLNQFVFERLAEELGIVLERSTPANVLTVKNVEDLGDEMTHTFLHELAAADVLGLVITYETSKERVFLRTIAESRYFHPVSKKAFKKEWGFYLLRNKVV